MSQISEEEVENKNYWALIQLLGAAHSEEWSHSMDRGIRRHLFTLFNYAIYLYEFVSNHVLCIQCVGVS